MARSISQIPAIFSLLLVFTVSRSPAQTLPFKNYSTKDGLVHNEVTSLYQDSRGYLWIGTIEGISRFDGASFTNYFLERDSSFAIPTTFVNTFAEDRKGNLWIGLDLAGGVAKFNLASENRSFVHRLIVPGKLSPSNYVKTMLQDSQGRLWLGVSDGTFILENGAFHFFPLERDTVKIWAATTALYEDRYGTIWIASHRGLYRYSKKLPPQVVRMPDLDTNQVEAICEDNEGNLWIGTNDIGLIKLENSPSRGQPPSHLKTYTTADDLPSNSVHGILQDKNGTLWIATWAGLSKPRRTNIQRGKLLPDAKKFITYTTANGLPSDNLVDLMQDREGNLWFATTNGISKLAGETIVNYGAEDGLPREFLLQVIRGGDDDLWFVSTSGASHFTGGKFVQLEALRGQHVLSVAAETTDAVWFGTPKGVVKWANGKILARYTTANGLPDNKIQSIFQDSGGALWFGHRRGVSRLKEDTLRHFYGDVNAPLLPGIAPDNAEYPLVIGMAEDQEGTVWFATYRHGVYKFLATGGPADDWVKVDIPISFRTRAIFCDRDNKIWIGTRLDGVFRYDPKTGALKNYTTSDGLPSNFVRSIFQDSRGNLWFGTTRGVSRFDGTRFRHYSTRDGLAGDAVFTGVEDEQGRLWFATSNGVSRYNPALERVCTIPPPVYVTRFRVFGKEQSLENEARLSASQHSVSFEYVGISFKDESRVRYQYRLKGLQGEWSELTDRRYVNYTNLSPGQYAFEVRARNGDGIRSFPPATFRFSIAAPLWRRWWFIGLMATAICAIVVGAHRYRLNKLLAMERMRSRIATDLHDEIGTSLSGIALFSEMARNEIQSFAPKVADKLKDVSETARQLVETMRDIVWAIRPGNDSLEDVVLYMKQFAAEVLEAKDIEFSFATPEAAEKLRLPMDVRHQLYLIFKEAINNLVRHSNACHAEISLNFVKEMLLLSIRDNGKGFDKSQPIGGNGLMNMKRRARAIKGTLEIDSSPGKGTAIVLRMPV